MQQNPEKKRNITKDRILDMIENEVFDIVQDGTVLLVPFEFEVVER